MGYLVTKAAWEHSRAKGNARLVLLALADQVIDEKVRAGAEPLAWPSQSTLSRMCGCSRSTVELALAQLVKLGEIRDTGTRHHGRYRGTVEWEVLPDVDLFAGDDLTDSRSGDEKESRLGAADLTENRSPRPDLTESRSGEAPRPSGEGHAIDDLTDSRRDLTDLGDDLTDSRRRPDRPVGHKQASKQEEEQEQKHGAAPAGAPPRVPFSDGIVSGLSPSSTGSAGLTPAQQQAERKEKEESLALLDQRIADGRGSSHTRAAAAELRDELGLEVAR
jgi:Helix-turn-helix domain